MAENLEETKKIIKRIFDLQNNYHGSRIAKGVKDAYLLHFLQEHWEEICGANLAKKCCIVRLHGQVLTIRTANSMLANELYMMKTLFLQKVNAFLLGKVIVKDLNFTAGGSIDSYPQEEQEDFYQPKVEVVKFQDKTCPLCGAHLREGDKICTVCQRQAQEDLRRKLAALLRLEPWLTYENCLKYYKCDRILFTAVKDSVKNFYFEQVRLGFADEKESRMAVLFLLGKRPEEIDEKAYNNALTYLRREQNVSTSRFGLHGKK